MSTSDAWAATFATTEHFNLPTARAVTVSEANGRASISLAAVSGNLIALAFVGQMSRLGAAFYAFALILLPVLAFVGVVTFLRLVQSSIEDLAYAQRIALLRSFYLRLSPELEPYLVVDTEARPARPGAWQLSPPSRARRLQSWGRRSDRHLRPTVAGRDHTMNHNTETAILAAGCFWGVQELLRHRDGVISSRVGYTGGDNDNPTYRDHPGHAEAVEIVFDPERISYREILEFFFQIHDPTTKDRQGNDIGSSYRSEIFYTSDEQRQVAENTIADVDASGLWPGKVVTEVSQAVPFWEAEPEHQDYLQHYPYGYTCHFPRPGWRLPHRETAA